MKKKSIKFNFLMNSLLTASSFIFPLITYPYVSRILGPENIGRVSFATSVVYYFAMFAQLGIPTYGISACARVRDDKKRLSQTVQEIMMINIVMTVIVYAVFAVSLFAVPRLSAEKPLFIITGLTILFNTLGVEWLYKALEQYSYITTVSILFKIVSVAAMFAFVHSPDDYVIYGGISIIAATGSSLMNFIRLRRFVFIRPVGGYNIKRHLKAIWVFFAMSVATTVYTNLDTVMLGFIKTDADVGYYNTAVKVKNILCSLVTSLGTVLLPRMSCLAEEKKWDEFYAVVKKALNFVLLLALPLSVFFILFARESIILLSGGAFLPSVVPMRIITPTIILIGITNVLGIQILVPLGKEKYVLYSEIAGAVINLAANTLLIPRLAASGAAIGTLVAEAVVLAVQFYVLRETVAPVFRSLSYFKIFLGLAAGCAAAFPIKMFSGLGSFLTLAVSAALYFGLYGGVLYLVKEPLVKELTDQTVGRILKKLKR